MPTCIILRGISGSGKSTLARKLLAEQPHGVIVSADNFFTDPETGAYEFDPTRIGDAHDKCMRDFLLALTQVQPVIVDNTNTTTSEVAPYLATARAMGYEVQIHTLICDIPSAVERCIHKVPADKILDQNRRLHSANLADLPGRGYTHDVHFI